jgi:hypothetical protein
MIIRMLPRTSPRRRFVNWLSKGQFNLLCDRWEMTAKVCENLRQENADLRAALAANAQRSSIEQ